MGGEAHPNERQAVQGNRGRKPSGCSAERMCGNEKEWIDCLQSDVEAFSIIIAGDWKSDGVGG